MGAHLSQPKTDKMSTDEGNELVTVGASAMQGWRMHQEDAHNCIINYDKDTSFFAVYDGHGGAEVAKYCSENLPNFVKGLAAYKLGEMDMALKEAFVNFDKTLLEPSVIETLKMTALENNSEDNDGSDNDKNDEGNATLKAVLPSTSIANAATGAGTSTSDAPTSVEAELCCGITQKVTDKAEQNSTINSSTFKEEKEQFGGVFPSEANVKKENISSTDMDAAASGSNDAKKCIQQCTMSTMSSPKAIGTKEESTDDDYDDEIVYTAEMKQQARSSEEGDVYDYLFNHSPIEGLLKEVEENVSVDEDPEPGKDSGCTAVVALLRGRDLYVANVGDSRCVVSRGGRAIEMSLDHKPEDYDEMGRIEYAGGEVTLDGRVNGGLNVSRALGDHSYKMNEKLPLEDQMISPLPDIKKLVITPEDEFMVLACDGIWNCMSSDQVVEFVRLRLNNARKLSKICEELFDKCLAPDCLCDCAGCDNMTAIIVRFEPKLLEKPSTMDSSGIAAAEAENCDEDMKAQKERQNLTSKQTSRLITD